MTSVKFKCLASGNVFEYKTEHDIKTMRTHPGYEEVKNTYEIKEEQTVRKPGRPPKAKEE